MLRKIAMAVVPSAALALAVAPTDASARGGHGGMGGGGGIGHAGGGWGGHGGWGHAGFARGGFVHGGFRRFGFSPHRRFFFAGAYPYYAYGSCWRWVAGPWGLHRVWVCGYRPYAYSYY